jgi:hypothetical protein
MNDLQNYVQKTNFKFRSAINQRLFSGFTAGPHIGAREGLCTVQSMCVRERERYTLMQGYTDPRRLVDYILYIDA